MQGRLYALEFEAQSVTNAGGDRDLFYVAPADDKPIIVIGWDFAQFSDLKDAEEEVLRLRLIRGHTTVGSGGTAFTNSAVYRQNPSDADAGFTARHNDTTIASSGTTFNGWSGGYNIRVAPAPFFLPERCWVPCTQVQGSVVLRLMAGPADDITMSGTLWVIEQG
jgi:hypothetical protein